MAGKERREGRYSSRQARGFPPLIIISSPHHMLFDSVVWDPTADQNDAVFIFQPFLHFSSIHQMMIRTKVMLIVMRCWRWWCRYVRIIHHRQDLSYRLDIWQTRGMKGGDAMSLNPADILSSDCKCRSLPPSPLLPSRLCIPQILMNNHLDSNICLWYSGRKSLRSLSVKVYRNIIQASWHTSGETKTYKRLFGWS